MEKRPDETHEEFEQAFANAILTPPEFGMVFRDLSTKKADAGDDSSSAAPCKTMYVIETDDNPADMSDPPKIYGAFWAETPDPVNKLAVALWPSFGSARFRDTEDNIDGKSTAPGECHQSSACLGAGKKFVALSVRRIQHTAEFRNFRTALVKKILESRGLPTNGDKSVMIQRVKEAKIIV